MQSPTSHNSAESRNQPIAAFTLIELLVVISILAVLAALIFPAMKGSLGGAKLVKCSSNLRQWGIGIQLYSGEHDGDLPMWNEVADDSSKQWQELIAPYVVQNAGTPGLQRFAMRAMLKCPGDSMTDGIVYTTTHYLRPLHYSYAPRKLIALNKPHSQFMLLTENYTGGVWTTAPWLGKGSNPGRVDYSRHPARGGVANFLFADFHIEPLSYQETLDRPVLVDPR